MQTKKPMLSKLISALLFLGSFMGFQGALVAQNTTTAPAAPDRSISIYQYRRVANDKREEFIKRETTYWAEVAKKAIAKGNLTFWGLFEKVGGYDLEHTSNFLFINTFKDIDNANDTWNPAAAFPNVTIDKMETGSISTTTSTLFLKGQGWEQAAGAVPEKDFKYVSMVYHASSNPANLIAAEKKHWAPFIKSAMDKKQTMQVAWGNAIILSPTGGDMKYNTVSYDLYSNLNQALNPWRDDKLVVPEGMTEIEKLESGTRGHTVYNVVKVVDTTTK